MRESQQKKEQMFLKKKFFLKLVFFINKINALERNPAVRLFYKQHHVLYTWLFYGVLIFYFVLLCFFTASAMRTRPVSSTACGIAKFRRI